MLQIVIAFFLSDYFELEFFSEKKKKKENDFRA